MPITATAKLGVKVNLGEPDIILYEGDVVRGLVYKAGTETRTIDGTVRVVHATTKAVTTAPDDCPPEPYLHRYITVTSLVIDSSAQYDAELTRINVENIIAIGSVNGKSNAAIVNDVPYGTIEEALAAANGEEVVLTQPVAVEKILQVNTPCNLNGNGESIIFAGNKLADKALVTVAEQENVTIKNMDVVTNKLVKHGIQLYNVKGATIENVEVDGGPYTAILVNGSTDVVIKDSVLHVATDSYCNIEYAMGASVTTIPSMTINNVTFDETAPAIWIDHATFERIRLNIGGTTIPDNDVIEMITKSIVNKNDRDIDVLIGITADQNITLTIPVQV